MITSFSLILVNDNFFAFTVSNYRCGYGCIFNVLANFQSVIAYCKYLIKSYGFSSFNAKFLYSDNIAFSYLVLFTTCCNMRSSQLLRCWKRNAAFPRAL